MTPPSPAVRRSWVMPYHLAIAPEFAVVGTCTESPMQVVLASDYDREVARVREEVEAYKKQCERRWCKGHHFNISVCSKCVFSDKFTPHTLANLEATLAAVRAELDDMRVNYCAALDHIKTLTPTEDGHE